MSTTMVDISPVLIYFAFSVGLGAGLIIRFVGSFLRSVGFVRVGILLGICLIMEPLLMLMSPYLDTLHNFVAMPTHIVTVNAAKRITIHCLNFSGVTSYLLQRDPSLH